MKSLLIRPWNAVGLPVKQMAFGLLEFTNSALFEAESEPDSEHVLKKHSKDVPEIVVRRLSASATETPPQCLLSQPLISEEIRSLTNIGSVTEVRRDSNRIILRL